MKTIVRLAALLCLTSLLPTTSVFSQPANWTPSGIGGGGALFSPSISPFNSQEYFLTCDMSDVFHSTNAGENWEVVPFYELTGGGHNTKVNFTADPNVLYTYGFTGYPNPYEPLKSTDAGLTWDVLPGDPTYGEIFYLFADPNRSDRLLITDYFNLYLSDDGGLSFTNVYTTAEPGGLHIAGVFWDGSDIYVGSGIGLLTSHNNGLSFSLENYADDLPNNYGMLTFTGSKSGSNLVFFCVSKPKADIWGGYNPIDYWSADSDVMRLVYGSAAGWELKNAGIPAVDFPYHVVMANDNTNTVYAAGLDGTTYGQSVYKSTNGGNSWTNVFETVNNQNIETAWMGDGGDLGWGWAENVLGLAVAPNDPNTLLISDWGFTHTSADGGASWKQVYSAQTDNNPSGSPTPKGLNYSSNGLEVTSVWWLTWMNQNDVFASYTDITGYLSADGGESWSTDFSYPTDYNSTYQVVQNPGNGYLLAAVSSVHDLYQSTYLADYAIDGGSGEIFYSTDGGKNWSVLHDFGHPVVWIAFDPNALNHIYASVVHSINGGIYASYNGGASWTKLSNPPRTQGHPLSIHVLNDGTLACSYSGRMNAAGFTSSSGVFISTDGGASWSDHTHPDMQRWTKDLVIDPSDPSQNTMYACVYSHWGAAPNEVGGIFRTTDRGLSWSRISNLYRVNSITVNEYNPELAYAATDAGLYYCENLSDPNPDFNLVTEYPFSHPLRTFVNPHDFSDIWVTSFGNGMRRGQECLQPANLQIESLSASFVRLTWDPVSNDAQYQLQARKLGSSTTFNLLRNQPYVQRTGLTPGVTYEVRLRLVCDEAYSVWTDWLTVSTPALRKMPTYAVYPNPASNELHITAAATQAATATSAESAQAKSANVKLFDSKGKLVVEANFDSQATFILDVSNVTRGLYILQVKNKAAVFTEQISIQ